MKKTLAVLFSIIMAFTSFAMIASAVGSPQTDGPVISGTGTDLNGKNINFGIKKLSEDKNNVFDTELKELQKEVDSGLKVIDKRNITSEDTVGFPVTMTYTVLGVTKNSTGYFLLEKQDGSIERIPAVMGDGTMTGVFSSLGNVAFVVDKDTATAILGESPKTETTSSAAPFVIALACFCAFAAGYSAKKIKASGC